MVELPETLALALDAAFLAQTSAAERSDLVYEIVRRSYDLVKAHGEPDERDSLATVSDAALSHQDRMHGWQ